MPLTTEEETHAVKKVSNDSGEILPLAPDTERGREESTTPTTLSTQTSTSTTVSDSPQDDETETRSEFADSNAPPTTRTSKTYLPESSSQVVLPNTRTRRSHRDESPVRMSHLAPPRRPGVDEGVPAQQIVPDKTTNEHRSALEDVKATPQVTLDQTRDTNSTPTSQVMAPSSRVSTITDLTIPATTRQYRNQLSDNRRMGESPQTSRKSRQGSSGLAMGQTTTAIMDARRRTEESPRTSRKSRQSSSGLAMGTTTTALLDARRRPQESPQTSRKSRQSSTGLAIGNTTTTMDHWRQRELSRNTKKSRQSSSGLAVGNASTMVDTHQRQPIMSPNTTSPSRQSSSGLAMGHTTTMDNWRQRELSRNTKKSRQSSSGLTMAQAVSPRHTTSGAIKVGDHKDDDYGLLLGGSRSLPQDGGYKLEAITETSSRDLIQEAHSVRQPTNFQDGAYDAIDSKLDRQSQLRWRVYTVTLVLSGCCLLFVILAAGMGLVVGFQAKKATHTKHTTSPPGAAPASISTKQSLENQSELTDILYPLLLQYDTGEVTIENIELEGTPQQQAYHHLKNDPSLSSYPSRQLLRQFGLITFYYATGGSEWSNNENWLRPGLDECQWHGIDSMQCEFEDEILLTLEGNGLLGTVPLEVRYIENLKRVDVSNNHITHIELDHILGMPRLTGLSLAGNTLSGDLGSIVDGTCEEEGNCESKFDGGDLELLDLSDNQYSGSLPKSFASLGGRLLELLLDGNPSLSGTIPESYCNLLALEYFALVKTGIAGEVPSCLCGISECSSCNECGL